MNYFSKKYDGGTPNLPLNVGDRFYSQDMTLDFWYMVAQTGRLVSRLLKINTVLISGGKVSQGSSLILVNIGAGVGYAQYDVTIPDSYSSGIPPTTKTETIHTIIESTAQTDLSLSTATLDGVTKNYVKLEYKETDAETRARVKKSGTYSYKISEDFTITINSTAPTDKQIVLAELIGDGSTFLTITNAENYNLDKLHLNTMLDEEEQAELYTGSGILYELSSPSLASNVGTIPEGSDIERNGNTGFGKLFTNRGCYYFEGLTSYLEIPDQLQNNDTIEFWIYPNWGASPANDQYIIDTRDELTDTDDFISLRFTTGNIYQLIAQDDAGNNVVISSGSIGSPNALTHIKIAWSKASQDVNLIINGTDQGTGTVTGTGIQFVNIPGKTGLVIGSENSLTNPLPEKPMSAWLTDLILLGSYDVTTIHYSAGKPYMSDNRIMGISTDWSIDNKGNISAKNIWQDGVRAGESFTGVDAGTMHLTHRHTTGVAGGSATSGAWRVVPINTTEINTISGASFDSGTNRFTLPAGKYKINFSHVFYVTSGSQLRIYNITDATVTALSEVIFPVDIDMCAGVVEFTIATPKIFELQYKVVTTKATNGLGLPGNLGLDELYGNIFIEIQPAQYVINQVEVAESYESGVFHIQDRRSAGTNGGSSVYAVWTQRDINTVIENTISGASLSTNQFTLPAGTYEINALSTLYAVNGAQIRLRNITDGVDSLYGLNTFLRNSSVNPQVAVPLKGRFTINSTKVFELQYFAGLAVPTIGLGIAFNTPSIPEIYTDVFIKIVPPKYIVTAGLKQNLSHVRVSQDIGQTITSTAEKVVYDTIEYDTQSNWDSVNSRFVAPANGFYAISAMWHSGSYTQTIGDILTLLLYKNGASFLRLSYLIIEAGRTGSWNTSGNTTIYLNAGDYIENWTGGSGLGAMTSDGEVTENYFTIDQLAE